MEIYCKNPICFNHYLANHKIKCVGDLNNMETIKQFLGKEDINLDWFNNQKWKKAFGCEFVKRAIKFSVNKTKKDMVKKIEEKLEMYHDEDTYMLEELKEWIEG